MFEYISIVFVVDGLSEVIVSPQSQPILNEVLVSAFDVQRSKLARRTVTSINLTNLSSLKILHLFTTLLFNGREDILKLTLDHITLDNYLWTRVRHCLWCHWDMMQC
jgi:hypothetical protein